MKSAERARHDRKEIGGDGKLIALDGEKINQMG
jgi:hypothetical protein